MTNYKRIGDYITPVKEKNTDGKLDLLLGINIDKYFMPSVANIVGTDLTKYQVVKPGQFACNRMHVGRDYRIPIALSQYDYDFIVSPAYDVFEIIDTEILDPEYLMMWFSRKEFDRNAWFYTDADVRGGLHWDAFCDMKLPIPHIDKQLEIVEEYNTIVNRIKLNEQLNQKLEETAQVIYKHWFVDFEFPNDDGKPYKSSGGKMVWCEELEKEIPEMWEAGNIKDIADTVDGDRGKNYPNQNDFSTTGYCLFLNTSNVTKNGFDFSEQNFISKEKDEVLRKGKLKQYDTILTTRGTVGNCAFYSESIEYENLRINSGMVIVRPKEIYTFFTYQLVISPDFKTGIENNLSGSAQPQLPIRDLLKIYFVKSPDAIIIIVSEIFKTLRYQVDSKKKENTRLLEVSNLFLAKLTKSEG